MWPTGESQERGLRPSKLRAVPSLGKKSIYHMLVMIFSPPTTNSDTHTHILRLYHP